MLDPGRRTLATTYVPGVIVSGTFAPTASTMPKFSWPMTRKSSPGGAAPYSAALISLSVPSTPTRRTFTSTPRPSAMSSTDGFGMSARWIEPAFPGWTAIAFTAGLSRAGSAALQSPGGAAVVGRGRAARRGTARRRRGRLPHAHARIRRGDVARRADVRLEPRRRPGGCPGGVDRRPARHRAVRRTLVAEDLALSDRRQ